MTIKINLHINMGEKDCNARIKFQNTENCKKKI